MKRLVLFVVLGLILLSVIGCSEGGGGGQGSPGTVPRQPTPVLVPQSQNLVNGMITVRAGGYYDQSFSVTSSMQNARITGSFRASGGSGNDIVTLIMDDMAFTNWVNGHQVQVYYQSGQITVANIDASLPLGKYHLVFSNTFSSFSSKSVSTKVDLNWSELRYQ
jgi:hypothetical protein